MKKMALRTGSQSSKGQAFKGVQHKDKGALELQQNESEYDKEIPQSHTAYQPRAP